MASKEVVIPGGYILLARKIIESQIWFKPPLYLKVWVYLLARAQHKPYKDLDKGQLFTSIPEIQEACYWYVGCRKVTPSKDQIFQVIAWLRSRIEGNDESVSKATMIATTRAIHGIVVSVNNYAIYQNPKSYESNDESNDEKSSEATPLPNNINKNVNKNVNIPPIVPSEDAVDYQGIVNDYHGLCPGLASVVAISANRKKHIHARLVSYGREAFRKVFEFAGKSAYHNGENDRKWKADFDWIINPNNFLKMLERARAKQQKESNVGSDGDSTPGLHQAGPNLFLRAY